MPSEAGRIGLLADLPPATASLKDRLYWASDGGDSGNGGLYQCNGASWRVLFSLLVEAAPVAYIDTPTATNLRDVLIALHLMEPAP